MKARASSVKTDLLHVQLVLAQVAVGAVEAGALHIQGGGGLAHLHVGGVAAGAAQLHHGQQGVHLLLHVLVHPGGVAGGEVAQVHALRRAGNVVHHQVLVDFLGHEGHEGGDDLAQGYQHVIQGGEGRFLVPGHALAPEALPATAHIPVGQFVHKVLDGAGAASVMR